MRNLILPGTTSELCLGESDKMNHLTAGLWVKLWATRQLDLPGNPPNKDSKVTSLFGAG